VEVKLYYKSSFEFDYRGFKQKIKNKRHLQKRTLDEQERHLILGMLSLEIKGKDLTSKAQQDLTVNVAINN
jgi:hypothetical protein